MLDSTVHDFFVQCKMLKLLSRFLPMFTKNMGANYWLCSGGSRLGHKVSGTQSKFPNLNENGQKSHFSLGFFDSEPGQNFV